MLSLKKEQRALSLAIVECNHCKREKQRLAHEASTNVRELIASPKGLASIAAAGAINQTLKSENSSRLPALKIARILVFQLF